MEGKISNKITSREMAIKLGESTIHILLHITYYINFIHVALNGC